MYPTGAKLYGEAALGCDCVDPPTGSLAGLMRVIGRVMQGFLGLQHGCMADHETRQPNGKASAYWEANSKSFMFHVRRKDSESLEAYLEHEYIERGLARQKSTCCSQAADAGTDDQDVNRSRSRELGCRDGQSYKGEELDTGIHLINAFL